MLKIRWGQAYLVLAAILLFTSPALARDDDSDQSSDRRQSSSDDSRSDRQSSDRQTNDRQSSDNDDHAQHHAALGVSIDDSEGKARVIAVLPGSPAARAGIRVGDEIRSVDDERIRTADGLIDEITDKEPGATVEISLRRNGERRTVEARLASHEATFGRRNRWSNQRASYGRYDSSDDDKPGNQQDIWRQLHQLQRQVSYLQQEVDQLRGQGRTYQSRGYQSGYQSNRSQGGRYSAGFRGARTDSQGNWQSSRGADSQQYRDDDRDYDDTDND